MALRAKPIYFYLTAIPDRLTELVTAECTTLTGSVPNMHGIAISEQCVDVRRGAYLKSCSELLFEASSLTELCAAIRSAGLHADEFRVSVVKKPRSLKANSMELARDIGSAIGGRANLSQPQVTFLAVVTAEQIWFGRCLSESDNMWLAHDQRPYVTSSSLPSRLARVLVNLMASPGDQPPRSVLRHRDNRDVGCTQRHPGSRLRQQPADGRRDNEKSTAFRTHSRCSVR